MMSRPNGPPPEEVEFAEQEELLMTSQIERDERSNNGDGINRLTRSRAWNLYTSHLLSTWNARSYEFAAIVFTATAYPDTLIASAIRGIITTISSILFSAGIGRWIDHAPNRLKTLLRTIAANRCSVIAACVSWVVIVGVEHAGPRERMLLSRGWSQEPISDLLRGALFATVLLLGVLEKLSGAANMMSMERDWVVTVANPDGQAYDLTHLNATMRRIDLICKLAAPITISVIISGTGSVRIGVLVVGAMSAGSWAVEWWCATRVWNNHPRLQRSKDVPAIDGDANCSGDNVRLPPLTMIRFRDHGLLEKLTQWIQYFTQDFINYFSTDVWIPSLALSLLHLSALSYSATFITYLLSAGFSLNLITLARAIGSLVEISSTVVTPFGISYLGKAHHHHHHHHHHLIHDQDDSNDGEGNDTFFEHSPAQHGNTEIGLERLGLWGITWQLLNLIPVALTLWALSGPSSVSNPSVAFPLLSRILSAKMISSPILLPLTLFTFLSFSRLGLWIFDLTTQQLTQTLVPPASRASFSGVENSFVAFFELGQHVATIVLNKPGEFKWLALGSLCAVGVSSACYAGWVRGRRGHLVHWDRLAGLGGKCRCGRDGRAKIGGGGSGVEAENRE